MTQENEIGERKMLIPFGVTTWLLIGGLVLMNFGCFITPSLVDQIIYYPFHFLCFWKHPWWYFIGLAVIIASAVRWYRLYRYAEANELADYEKQEAFWFRMFSGTVTAVAVFMMATYKTGWMFTLYRVTFTEWLGKGNFTMTAFMAFMVSVTVICAIIALGAKWKSTF